MGYPVDKIGPETRLFSLIGVNAIESKRESLFNNAFQQLDADCKMMPLNIREDDLGFFLHGLKNSKINGAYLEREYWKSVFDLLGEGDYEVQTCGICDTITIENNQYRVELTQGKATLACLENMYGALSDKSVTIIGSSASAKSFLIHLIQRKPDKILLTAPIVEDLLQLSALIPEDILHEIVRIQDRTLDCESDITVNFEENPMSIQNTNYLDFNRDFDKILQQIANIKTKKWSL